TILAQIEAFRRKETDPGQRGRLEKIERAAERMNRIIEDLFEVAMLEEGQLAIHGVHVSAARLVADAVESQRAQADSRSLELRVEAASDLPEVLADADRIQQVFENLIGNAMKFTARGSVTVGARPDAKEVLFWVADTGEGIRAEDMPRLFDRFWQA